MKEKIKNNVELFVEKSLRVINGNGICAILSEGDEAYILVKRNEYARWYYGKISILNDSAMRIQYLKESMENNWEVTGKTINYDDVLGVSDRCPLEVEDKELIHRHKVRIPSNKDWMWDGNILEIIFERQNKTVDKM